MVEGSDELSILGVIPYANVVFRRLKEAQCEKIDIGRRVVFHADRNVCCLRVLRKEVIQSSYSSGIIFSDGSFETLWVTIQKRWMKALQEVQIR